MKLHILTAALTLSTNILVANCYAKPQSYEFFPRKTGEQVPQPERNREGDLTRRAVRENLQRNFTEEYERLRTHNTDSLDLERREFQKNKQNLEEPSTEAWERSFEHARRGYEIR